MNAENLYSSCIKMISDKYNIHEYSKEKFLDIYYNTYKENNANPEIPNNKINKLILIKIRDEFETDLTNQKNKDLEPEVQKTKDLDIEKKLKEYETIIANMNLISSAIDNQDIINDDIQQPVEKERAINTIQINNQEPIMINKFKTFIINTTKNNFKVNTKIDINNNYIYPCCLCMPNDIKYITPYIILSINDGMNNINYTYILNNVNSNSNSGLNNIWDIWKPITKNYMNINLNSNNWHINLIDYMGNSFDFNKYYDDIIDVLENKENNTFSISIQSGENNKYYKNNKIKIIQNNGVISENLIVNIDNYNDNKRFIIKKNNLELNDFINSKIYNYNNQLSLLFKYYSK